MGFLRKLFGSMRSAAPLRIAPGRGYTFNIEGEAAYQAALDRTCGGKCEDGHNLEVTAELRIATSAADVAPVSVSIGGERVGYVAGADGTWLWREIVRVNPEERPISCGAKIVGGWSDEDGEGHYGVKLSISKPLRLETDRRA